MSPAVSSPATPRKFTDAELRASASRTPGACCRQVGHHGAQNHSTVGFPASDAPSNGLPSTVVPVKPRNHTPAGTAGASDGDADDAVPGADEGAAPAAARQRTAHEHAHAQHQGGGGPGPAPATSNQERQASPSPSSGRDGQADLDRADDPGGTRASREEPAPPRGSSRRSAAWLREASGDGYIRPL